MIDIQSATADIRRGKKRKKLECGPMPTVMAALLNIGGALCSTAQSFADAGCPVLECGAVTPGDVKYVEISWGAPN